MGLRTPTVAGTFYASTASGVIEQIEWSYRHDIGPGQLPEVNESGPRNIVGLVAPHAGYMASGPVAAHAYDALARDGRVDTAIIVGPNHTGYGSAVSVWASGAWRTPLGDAQVDENVAHALLGGVLRSDESAHIYEHSIEVQVPWLQHLYGADVRIVPVAILAQDSDTALAVGEALAAVEGNVVMIASTDLSHYESLDSATRKDAGILSAIECLDSNRMYRYLDAEKCTMCGYGPVAAVMHAARSRGATHATLLKYATSGDTIGDYSRVVGYASAALSRGPLPERA
ncbi:AmmeMemoRadiSam system protein B [Chloroflexota bacterium]